MEILLERRLRIPVEPVSRTIPSSVATEEVKRLNQIRESSGRVVWAYYLGRAVIANALMPTSDGRLVAEYYRDNIAALGYMVKQVEESRLLRAGYNKGVMHELVARRMVFPLK